MFVTFEGPEGSGKTTQIHRLCEYLEGDGKKVLVTREPGGTEIGDQIRAVLHDVQNTAMRPNTEILLYSASRAQLVGQVIRPALADGQMVLSDRYADSTMAYQGYGHGLDLRILGLITDFATGGLKPDLTIYLDIAPEDGLLRKKRAFEAGESELNRMDRKDLAFYHRVRAGYFQMAAQEPDRWVIVDASRFVEEIQEDIRAHVMALLKRHRSQKLKGG